MTIFFILLNTVLIGGMAWWFRRSATPAIAGAYWPALMAKLFGGVALGLLYKYYFESGSDTFGFFNDALRINEWAMESPFAYVQFFFGGKLGVELYNSEPRTLLFISLLSIVTFVSGMDYWITSCWLSLFSFLCAWRLFEVLSSHFPQQRTVMAIALFFFPSIVFWSSGVLKESLAWGSMCLITAAFVDAMFGRMPRLLQWLLLPIALLLLLNLKYYWAAVALVCMATSLLLQYSPARRLDRPAMLTVLWLVVFTVLVLVASRTHPNFYLERFVGVIVDNHNQIAISSEAGNTIHYYNIHHAWGSLFVNAPWALVSGLFRPFIFEAHSLASAIYAIENFVLLFLLLAWMVKPRWSRQHHLLLVTALVCTIVLCVFLSLSTPNFGTLSRYRIGFLPFLVIVLLADSPVMKYFPLRLRLEKP